MKTLFYILISLVCYPQLVYAQWFEQTTGVTTELLSVSAVDNNIAWACGVGGTVVKTTNGGETWTDVSGNGIPNLTLNSISCRTASMAMVTGTNTRTSAFVYITSDGGNTWTETFSVIGGYIYGIVYTSAGNFGLHSDPIEGYWRSWWSPDNGSHWNVLGQYPQEGSETGWNNALCVFYPIGWHGTNNSRLYNSPNSYVWSPQPTPGLTNSKAVWFKSYDVGMAGGDGMVFTTDGGSSWTLISVPGTGDILGIAAAGTNWWFVRGSSVYHSTDDGSTWSMVYTAPSGTFNHLVKARYGDHLWAVRSNGGISSTHIPVGVEDERNEAIPDFFSLTQNYPNPFNPSTTIKYQIPHVSFATLKVFDVLGNEVSTLVFEEKPVGSYEVEFDAKELPSGVYFYQFKSGSFIETKKMILLR